MAAAGIFSSLPTLTGTGAAWNVAWRRPVTIGYVRRSLPKQRFVPRLMHGIQQYELDPDSQGGVPIVEVHHQEAGFFPEAAPALGLNHHRTKLVLKDVHGGSWTTSALQRIDITMAG